jgi:hypothetical protein
MMFEVTIPGKFNPLEFDMATRQCWKLINTATVPGGIQIVRPRSILRPGETRIEFDELQRRRLVWSGLFTQECAELIFNKICELPRDKHWRDSHLVFPDTVWANGPFLQVPVVHFLYPWMMELYFRWVGHGFTERDKVITIAGQ